MKITDLTAEEQAKVAGLKAMLAKSARMVTSDIPEDYRTTCPKCGEIGHATLVAQWGHCMRCHQRA